MERVADTETFGDVNEIEFDSIAETVGDGRGRGRTGSGGRIGTVGGRTGPFDLIAETVGDGRGRGRTGSGGRIGTVGGRTRPLDLIAETVGDGPGRGRGTGTGGRRTGLALGWVPSENAIIDHYATLPSNKETIDNMVAELLENHSRKSILEKYNKAREKFEKKVLSDENDLLKAEIANFKIQKEAEIAAKDEEIAALKISNNNLIGERQRTARFVGKAGLACLVHTEIQAEKLNCANLVVDRYNNLEIKLKELIDNYYYDGNN